jgi:hypothetical protein
LAGAVLFLLTRQHSRLPALPSLFGRAGCWRRGVQVFWLVRGLGWKGSALRAFRYGGFASSHSAAFNALL